MIKYYILLLVSILITSGVQITLKIVSEKFDGNLVNSLADPRLYLAISLYILALIAWFVSASRIQFSVLIPANVLTVVLGGLIGYSLFDEVFGLRKIISYLLIIAGILLLISESYQN